MQLYIVISVITVIITRDMEIQGVGEMNCFREGLSEEVFQMEI